MRVATAAIVAEGRGASPPTRGAPQEVASSRPGGSCEYFCVHARTAWTRRLPIACVGLETRKPSCLPLLDPFFIMFYLFN